MIRRVASIAALLSIAACGLGAQDDSRRIAERDVPYGLLAPSTTTTTRPPPSTTTTLAWRTNLWFVSGARLQPAPRQLRTQPTVTRVIELLLRGPLTSDPTSMRTALRALDATAAAAPAGGALTIDLAETFGERPSSQQILALGQLVYTVTEVPGVGRVVFRIGGADLAVPLPDGRLAQGSVSRDDFASLIS